MYVINSFVFVYFRGERREVQTLINYQNMVAKIQRDAIWWLQETVVKMYHPSAPEFSHIMHKVSEAKILKQCIFINIYDFTGTLLRAG